MWARRGQENAEELTDALSQFGIAKTKDQAKELAQEDKIWRIGLLPYRIGIMTSVSGSRSTRRGSADYVAS